MITNNLQFSGHKKIRSHAKKPFSNPLTPNSPAYPLVRSNSQWEKKKREREKRKKSSHRKKSYSVSQKTILTHILSYQL